MITFGIYRNPFFEFIKYKKKTLRTNVCGEIEKEWGGATEVDAAPWFPSEGFRCRSM